jgi:hypothetical protein
VTCELKCLILGFSCLTDYYQKNMPVLVFTIRPLANCYLALFLCVFLSSYSNIAYSQEIPKQNFESKEHQFAINYPESFIPVLLRQEGVLLALRDKQNNYPTFNIIVQAGEYQYSKLSKDEKAKQILNSYKLVGINDAEIQDTEDNSSLSVPNFNIELAYSLNKNKLRSYVSILPGLGRHFIFTFIDTENSFINTKPQAISIRNSFKLLGNAPLSNSNHKEISLFQNTGVIMLLIILGLVLLIIAIYFLVIR